MTKQSTQFLWKIGAPAGLGVMTTGQALSKLASRSGYQIYSYAEYPSLIKGGHNTYEVNISLEPVTTIKNPVDCLACFDVETYKLHQNRLHAESRVLFDTAHFAPDAEMIGHKIAVPMYELLAGLKADKIMINMIGLGASFALLGGKKEILDDMIAQQFKNKGDEVVQKNIVCAMTGYEYVMEHFASEVQPVLEYQNTIVPHALLAGNEAFSFGAVAADCKFFAAYPMSPATSVLETLAAWSAKTGMVVRHAEDEVGVINETLGAAFAGVRACTATSGGGFALMTEAISYAGIAELPVVIFLAQRPGPATGMPTWTEQGDLLTAAFAGHGEFPKIIIAPGDPLEMIALGALAFDLADIYQTPVTVLSDKVLSESHYSVPVTAIDEVLARPIDRGKTITNSQEKPYQRYWPTEDGISARLIPGQSDDYYQANSYEHLPDSHTTEDAVVRKSQVDKRARKIDTYFKNHFVPPAVFGDLDSAKTIIVSWGGNKGVILEAQKQLAELGQKTAYVHFTHVFPLSKEKIESFFNLPKKYVLIENNATGQFGMLLKMTTRFEPAQKLLKYDGRPFFVEEIVRALSSTVKIESTI